MNGIRVNLEDPRSTSSTTLIKELSAELAIMYPDFKGGDGSGAFKPEDVLLPRAAFIVAWDGVEPVGCGALRPMPDDNAGEIKRMFVRKPLRGRGISRLILTELENQARRFGYPKLMLETGILQVEAIGLYESVGYRRIDCYGIYKDEAISMCYEKLLDG